jgi:hypothetical protein
MWPSFNPSGTLLAYTQGTSSRSTTAGDLMLARVDDQSGDAARVRLTRANPMSSGYSPTFNPKVEGGYQWIAFYSRRNYGHRVTGRPQIWVAAIDDNADPSTGVDPSHPAFWLPGQVESTENLSSFFAPKPCEDTGGLCDTDAACCGDGLCRPVGGVSQCVPPDQACALPDDGCTTDADCCEGINCVDDGSGVFTCQPPGVVCSEEGQVCQLDADCCDGAGLCVDDGAGVSRCAHGTCAELGATCGDARPCCGAPQVLCLESTCLLLEG